MLACQYTPIEVVNEDLQEPFHVLDPVIHDLIVLLSQQMFTSCIKAFLWKPCLLL